MTIARIYRPARTATQSGTAKTEQWVLEFEPAARKQAEPLMGWTSSTDMNAQVKLKFPSLEDAIAYATRENIAYRVEMPQDSTPKNASYYNNFATARKMNWTH